MSAQQLIDDAVREVRREEGHVDVQVRVVLLEEVGLPADGEGDEEDEQHGRDQPRRPSGGWRRRAASPQTTALSSTASGVKEHVLALEGAMQAPRRTKSLTRTTSGTASSRTGMTGLRTLTHARKPSDPKTLE